MCTLFLIPTYPVYWSVPTSPNPPLSERIKFAFARIASAIYVIALGVLVFLGQTYQLIGCIAESVWIQLKYPRIQSPWNFQCNPVS